MNFDRDLFSEILPNLWQGGTGDFDTLEFPKSFPVWGESKPWDSVATLYAVAHPMGWGIREQRFGFPDSALSDENIPHILEIAEWLHKEWKSGKKVLARCQAGWNRSGLVIALVLMKEGLSADEAIALIRERRSPNALCNADFVRYLRNNRRVGSKV